MRIQITEATARMSDVPNPAPRQHLPVGAESLPQGGVHFRVWA
jgi:hypothetical protein